MFDYTPIPLSRSIVVYRKHRIRAKKVPERVTICEVLRRLYIRAEEAGDLYSQNLLAEAYDMGKRMDAKLRAYKFEKRDIAVMLSEADRIYGDIKRDINKEE